MISARKFFITFMKQNTKLILYKVTR